MTKAIIAVPIALTRHQLTSLEELLTRARPNLRYEFEPDGARSRAEVRAFVPEGCLVAPAESFAAMSALQSALFRFDADAANPHFRGN